MFIWRIRNQIRIDIVSKTQHGPILWENHERRADVGDARGG